MADGLRVYFHYHSPYSRLALNILMRENVPARTDFSLHTLSHSAGEGQPPAPTRTRARMAYVMKDAARMTERMGLPMAMPDPIMPDYLPAATYFYGIETMSDRLAFATALSNMRWGNGKDISKADVLDAALTEARVSSKPVDVDMAKAQLKADQERVEKDLAFGVPFAVLERDGKKEPFFGQDRLDLLLERLS